MKFNSILETVGDTPLIRLNKLGPEGVANRLPQGAPVYITIDIDAFCPSIAPGTGTPSHGGFLYYEVLELLQGAARRHHRQRKLRRDVIHQVAPGGHR